MTNWVIKSIFKKSLGKVAGVMLLLGMILTVAFFYGTTDGEGEENRIFPTSATGEHRVGNREIPIYCVETEQPKVAISFDAAWGNEETEKLLKVLEDCNVKATFFMTGEWVDKYPEDVKKILEAGHDLGNHSCHHYDAKDLSKDQMKEELLSVHEKVKELTGTEMTLFRPPYGSYNDGLIDTCVENGYYCIQWDVDSLDWKNYGVDSIVKTVLNHKHLGNGSIILLHNGATYTADALEAVITGLQEKGYEIVKISDLIYHEQYKIDVEGRQISTKED